MTGAFLMGSTLPTVIGMGVVSETTRVMFDKKGRRIRSKSKQKQGDTVIVGNRLYKLHTGDRGGRYYTRKGRKIYV